MGRIKQHFLDQGLTAKDIPLAFACVFTHFPLFFVSVFIFFFFSYCFLCQTKIQIGKCSHILFSLTLTLSYSLALFNRFHEVFSIAFAASTWVAAYGIQPSKTICQPFANIGAIKNNVQPVFVKMLESSSGPARAAVKRIPMLAKADPTRLTVALAESLTLRAFIKPITFGGKLWVTYEFMKFVKSKTNGDASAAQTGKTKNGKKKVASVSLSVR
jgi:hypothetical protein